MFGAQSPLSNSPLSDRVAGQVEVLAGQVNCRGSLPCSASNVLEPMLHPFLSCHTSTQEEFVRNIFSAFLSFHFIFYRCYTENSDYLCSDYVNMFVRNIVMKHSYMWNMVMYPYTFCLFIFLSNLTITLSCFFSEFISPNEKEKSIRKYGFHFHHLISKMYAFNGN